MSTGSYGIGALESGLLVLRVVGESPDLNVPQLAARTGITKSKVFRILRTLEALGYVVFDDAHTVRLGSAALIMGHYAADQYTLTQAAKPVLDELAQQTQENVYLMLREGHHALVIDVRMSPQPLRTFARVGRIAALYAGGAPKLLLAYAPDEVIEAVLSQPLEVFASQTITQPDTLRQVLADIRQDGVHVAVSDLQEQVFALAAPVFDHRGQMIAALSIAGPMMRFDEVRREQYLRWLKQSSQAISARLGRKVAS